MKNKKGTAIDKIKKAFIDGYQNLAAALSTSSGTVMSQGTYVRSGLTKDKDQLTAAYRTNWVVGAMVDYVAEDMTREGITLTGEIDQDKATQLQRYLVRSGLWKAITDLIRWARLYGGALGVINIEGQQTATPLDIRRIGKGQFNGLLVYDRHQVQPDPVRRIKTGPKIGLPEYYLITAAGKAVETVHHSRCVRMIGIELPGDEAVTEQYWGASIVERIHDRLLSFDQATIGSADLIRKAHVKSVKIDGFRDVLAAGSKAQENMTTAWLYTALMENSQGVTLLDKTDEVAYNSYTFAGLSDMMTQFGQQLCGAGRMPATKVFGQAPAGMNATGESDTRNYYDGISSEQETRLREPIHLLLECSSMSLFGQPLPADFDFDFNPLWQTTEQEKATAAQAVADAVVKVSDAGIIGQATALKELKKSSEETGIFSTISQEEIEEAEAEPPEPVIETPPPADPVAHGVPANGDLDAA